MNEVLRRAMFDAQLTEVDLSARLAVDPKTVRNWLKGQMPHPQTRAAITRLLGIEETALWPSLCTLGAGRERPSELAAVYPRRMAISQQSWLALFSAAQSEIGVLAYSALFLAEDARLVGLLGQKAAQGVRVRIALGDPEGRNVDRRGVEEEIGEAMSMKIRNAIAWLSLLLQQDGVELRLHDTVLYNSMYRSDDQLLVNQHAFGIPAAQSPVYHFRDGVDSEMFRSYLTSFERIWTLGRAAAVDAGSR
ncbi:XRE family transcriptional regulator [Kribbella sp. CA-294648]|uniref:XRE family transcriptional regulator n=1 Tax=Kribbella sp. CA-294648 TaxID=3239948 RepID=UPI003D918C21